MLFHSQKIRKIEEKLDNTLSLTLKAKMKNLVQKLTIQNLDKVKHFYQKIEKILILKS